HRDRLPLVASGDVERLARTGLEGVGHDESRLAADDLDLAPEGGPEAGVALQHHAGREAELPREGEVDAARAEGLHAMRFDGLGPDHQPRVADRVYAQVPQGAAAQRGIEADVALAGEGESEAA